MVAEAFTVDLNKPLVFQVGHLGEAYDEWVHQPIVSKESPRFFANGTLEFLTRTAWWAIPLIWIPVVSWFVTMSVKLGLPTTQVATTMAAGIIIWTLLEYSLHRFLFHMKTKGYWANTIHYLIHGCHHKHPMDGLRLVFPPAATAILLVPVWSLIKLLVPSTYVPALFAGGLLGYVMYDCTHYYLHHGRPLQGVSHNLKKAHMHHHFKVQDKGFGITSAFWDKVFGTIPPELAEKKVTGDAKQAIQDFVVDLNKPLVFQVGHLGEAYQEWVHQPIVSKEGPRFFESGFWEFLTRTEWWVIPLVWLPVVNWFILKSIRMGHALHQAALLLVFGICIWSLMEYTLHRFLFHIKTKSYWGNTLHYLLHGCHHKHPMDGLRLVFPPAATAVLCIPFYNFIKLLATPSTTPALFGGGLLGYVMYDVTHYYLHHGQPTSEVPKNLKKYHLNHHFRIQNKGFGITSSLWDKVFGTLPTSKSAEKSR